MVAKLREKPGGERIPVAIGDFASTRVEDEFRLAYLVFNTSMNLTTQAEQVACFEDVAAHLEPGGVFVIEVGVPRPSATIRVLDAGGDHWGIDEFDIATQGSISHHFQRREDGAFELLSMPFRYAWPAELDLMATLAGIRLRDRWAGWRGEPFTSESRRPVSVWEKT